MRNGLARAALVGAAAVVLGSISGLAQTVTFSTTGTFAGDGCSPTACPFGPFTLTFVNAGSNSYGAPTDVDLGSFSTVCPACTTVPATAIAAGVQFTLTINQTTPTGGTGAFVDGITGSLGYNPITSTLVWSPITTSLTIAGVTYKLITDNTGNIVINAPTGDQNPNLTAVKATITTTPEPSTAALMAAGLLVLVPAVRRRRK
jgi:hypothetical protein